MKLKKKAWWENVKVWLVIGLVLLIVVLVIVIMTTSPSASSEAAGTSSPEMVAGVGGGAVEDKGTGMHPSPHSLCNSAAQLIASTFKRNLTANSTLTVKGQCGIVSQPAEVRQLRRRRELQHRRSRHLLLQPRREAKLPLRRRRNSEI